MRAENAGPWKEEAPSKGTRRREEGGGVIAAEGQEGSGGGHWPSETHIPGHKRDTRGRLRVKYVV